ncbi:uncharacterized protein BT62DRAFT_925998 [Guyanagaster necrorhizus]|uniref:F-box domain-containing protein n=1 Tax=Guyanagaster necrorhizus TaxID=856835 RepID=A0A9P8AY27_9AGAR|nr:uncharacterized protein BT62DRAFT_925998 [Guyanagaster necrorhizus MCA 3950]KAG7451821.1 hypothetical protein BT62DRAFT_925998 [Guyanagaster necrorhizus MCA 3950]
MNRPILICFNCGAGLDVDASYTKSLDQDLELLRSGDALLSAEAPLFPQFIMRAEFDLIRYDREIKHHLDTIERLRRDRAEVEEYIKQKKSLLAPIRRLPPELLCAVFKEAIRVEDPTSSLRIALVCSYWRRLALGTYSLWSTITLDLQCPFSKSSRDIYGAWIPLYLHRSEGRPLQVVFRDSRHNDADLDTWPSQAVLSALFAEARRWREVHISFMHSRSFYFLRELIKVITFPGLELLDVTYFGGSNGIDAMTSVILLAPNLRTLSFRGHLLSNNDGAPMPPNKIRTFRADMVLSDIGHFVSTIASMPELTHVTVGCFTCRYSVDRPLEVLSHLTSLTLLMHDYSYNNLQAIIKPLLLPNLSSLSLVHEKGASTRCFLKFAHLEHLLQSCADSLRWLHILYLPIEAKDLILVLEKIPGLHELVIHWPKTSRASMEAIIRYLSETRQVKLPQLMSLELVWCQEIDERMVMDMVEMRTTCTPLHRVSLGRDVPRANLIDKTKR